MKKIIFAALACILPFMAHAEESDAPNSIFMFGAYYKTTSFDAFKEAGGYGFDMAGYFRCGGPSSKAYLGITFQPFQFNFGLVGSDYTSDQISFGISPLFYANDTIQLMCPFNITVNTAFTDTMKELLGKNAVWGFEFVPHVKCSILDIGLVLSKSFNSSSKLGVGIYLGLTFKSK